jgi:hypothetical protein
VSKKDEYLEHAEECRCLASLAEHDGDTSWPSVSPGQVRQRLTLLVVRRQAGRGTELAS